MTTDNVIVLHKRDPEVTIVHLSAKIVALESQRDDLLAACEAARDDIIREMTGTSIQTGQVLDQLQAAISRARAE